MKNKLKQGERAIRSIVVIGCTSLVAGCAGNPPMTFHYNHARSSASMQLDARVACKTKNDGSKEPIVVFGFKPDSKAEANPAAKTGEFDTSKLSSQFSNSDVHVQYFADGRLKGINTKTTGQGSKIIEAAVSLAATIGGAPLLTSGAIVPTYDATKICTYVDANADQKTKLLTLKYTAHFYPNSAQLGTPMIADLATQSHLSQEIELNNFMGKFDFSVTPSASAPALATSPDETKGYSSLPLYQPSPAIMELTRTINVTNAGTADTKDDVLWTGNGQFGQFGTYYELLVPNAATFGARTFALELYDSGALKSVKYTDESGLKDTLGSGKQVFDLVDGQSLEEKTKALNAELDYRKALERLAQCEADPSKC
ncbi:hypothetical protein [Parasphingorhabdus sp.]|uniref:hypothetical protein n=1 Tax=Parasphingorhabdus sp. TaxID=2709688 RepID=UPI003A8E1A7E